jgi:glycosyltransferase involved in cell wall biosynthesis
MPNAPLDLSLVVATRNRLPELRRMLRSLEPQSSFLREVIVVDGSDEPIEAGLADMGGLPLRYVRCFPPSAARQRNAGTEKASPGAAYVGFMDDDIVLEPGALAAMADFWSAAPGEAGGAAFNLINHPGLYAPRLKTSRWAERLGLYSRTGGKVMPSGFQTMIGRVRESTRVEWISTGAVVWRRAVLERFHFDEWFGEYSYLEDLDFSLQVSPPYQLWVVGGAGFYHYPAMKGRGNDFQFGRREVLNRIHLVRKHPGLSLGRCRLALILRIGINLSLLLRGHGSAASAPGSGDLERNIHYGKRALGIAAGLVQTIL